MTSASDAAGKAAADGRLPGPVVHPDLADTTFLDAGALAALADTARALRAERQRLVLPERVAALFPQECSGPEMAA